MNYYYVSNNFMNRGCVPNNVIKTIYKKIDIRIIKYILNYLFYSIVRETYIVNK